MRAMEFLVGEKEYTVASVLRREGYSSRYIRKVKRAGMVLIDGREALYGDRIKAGQMLYIVLPEEKGVLPQDVELNILYEDESILIVDKPRGILVHPTTKQSVNTMANAIAAYLGGQQPVHLVSRLDKDTSGILIVAKNGHIKYLMSKLPVKKCYIAAVCGSFPAESGVIDLNMARKEGSIIERVVDIKGKSAKTFYRVLKKYDDGKCLAEFELKTGRTHQIRVHAAFMGCPLFGDWLYSNREDMQKYLLHAYRVSFCHPVSQKLVDIKIGLPDKFADIYGIIDL